MELEDYIRSKGQEKSILLMTHIVLGYPSFDECYKMLEAMVRAGADLVELQIPFSEPIADGPTILKANQAALDSGVKVKDCMDFAAQLAKEFRIPFLFMTYFNIVLRYGLRSFVADMAKKGLHGSIIADLPPEEATQYVELMSSVGLNPIFLFSPTTPRERMRYIASLGRGFIYCVARKGVTGAKTEFSQDISAYLATCRSATSLPLAVGFGVKGREDVEFLKGKVEIAVIGSHVMRIFDQKGIEGIEAFIRGLR